MKIQRHKDGSYSLTGMTAADVENLAFGALSAEVFYGKPDPAIDSPDFALGRRRMFGRLYNILHALAAGRHYMVDEVTSDRLDGPDACYKRAAAGTSAST